MRIQPNTYQSYVAENKHLLKTVETTTMTNNPKNRTDVSIENKKMETNLYELVHLIDHVAQSNNINSENVDSHPANLNNSENLVKDDSVLSSINLYGHQNDNQMSQNRTSSEIDMDLLHAKATNGLKRTNFVSTDLPSDDNNNINNSNDYGENNLNSNELYSNELASSIENFLNDNGVEEAEGLENDSEASDLSREHIDKVNEEENISPVVNVNDVKVDLELNDAFVETQKRRFNEVKAELLLNAVEKNEKPKKVSSVNEAELPEKSSRDPVDTKTDHRLHTSIAPFQSNLMNDFDNQYLWDYSDNNKFQKF